MNLEQWLGKPVEVTLVDGLTYDTVKGELLGATTVGLIVKDRARGDTFYPWHMVMLVQAED